MKKVFFFILFIFLIQSSILSQLQIGAMGGPQFSIRQYNKNIADNGFKTSVNAGAISIIHLSKKIKLHATFGYSGKGVVLKDFIFNDGGGDINVGDIDILLHYLELRSPIDYCINLSSQSTLLLGAGPYFSYAVSGRQKIKKNNYFSSFLNRELDFEDEYNRFEFGVTSNASLQLKRGWLFGIYTDIGLTNIFKPELSKTISHRSFAIAVGYIFFQQKKKDDKK